MALVTPTCLLVGVCFPDIAKCGLPYVPAVFAFITFAGALKSRFRDVANVFRHPGALLIIMLLLHVVIPAAACGAGHIFFGDNMDLITGMVLEFAVPTAVVSLMWVTIYEGNSPLSLSLVVLDTVLAPFLIPATLRILLGSAVTMDPAKMMRELVFMVALPAIAAMTLNQVTDGKVMKTWPGKLAPFSKLALMFVVTSNSSKVAPYIRNMNMQRVKVALAILVLAASGYALGWLVAHVFRRDRSTAVSMMYGTGMRNISAGAVIAAAYFPGEVTIDYPPKINNALNNSVVSEKSKDEMSLDEYKQWVMNQISQFPVSGWVRSTFSSGSIVIKEEAFERMKNDPEYENYVLNRVRSAYSVQGLPVGSNNVSFDVIGASPEECYGYAGPVGKSGSETANDGESWWEKRHERMEELMKEQEKEAVKRAQARRKAVQNEYLNSQLAAAAYEKSSIILPDNPVIL